MQLTGALEQRLEDLKARLVQFAADPGLLGAGLRTTPADGEALAPAPPHPFDFTGVFAPGESARPLATLSRQTARDASAGTALLADLIEAARANAAGGARETPGNGSAPRDLAVSRLAFDAAALAAVAVPVARSAGRQTLVVAGYQRLEGPELRRLADLHAIDRLRVVTEEPRDGSIGLAVLDGAGNPAGLRRLGRTSDPATSCASGSCR